MPTVKDAPGKMPSVCLPREGALFLIEIECKFEKHVFSLFRHYAGVHAHVCMRESDESESILGIGYEKPESSLVPGL